MDVARVSNRFCALIGLSWLIYVFECLLRLPNICDSNNGASLRQDARAFDWFVPNILSDRDFYYFYRNWSTQQWIYDNVVSHMMPSVLGGLRTILSCLQRLHAVYLSPCTMIYSMVTNVSCNIICSETDEDWRLDRNWFHRVWFGICWRQYLHQSLGFQDCLFSGYFYRSSG